MFFMNVAVIVSIEMMINSNFNEIDICGAI